MLDARLSQSRCPAQGYGNALNQAFQRPLHPANSRRFKEQNIAVHGDLSNERSVVILEQRSALLCVLSDLCGKILSCIFVIWIVSQTGIR